MRNHGPKYKILIADDAEMNREILTELLQDEFDIIEVENGRQAISVLQQQAKELSLVLLDIVMPEMDGFEVLAYMNRYHWIEDVPVIMISSETSPTYIKRAYDFGAADYISRPFDAAVVHRRVSNTIMLYAKQRKLTGMVAAQIYEKEKSNNLMVTILSHIVEFRNGESGLHVLHINTLTDLLLKSLVLRTDQYKLTKEDISRICVASALHDIGKIAIPYEILNKPGRLTPEEFEVMKTHSAIGAAMLDELPAYQDEPLVRTAYEICRWHHERYDGKGYPDGLKGDRIPISAQIVALADVYDALTSERCYKKAFSHETAMEMILDGQCGVFNPLLMECLKDIGDVLQKELRIDSVKLREQDEPQAEPLKLHDQEELQIVADELMKQEEFSATEHMLQLLECERTKFQFVASASPDIIFVYTNTPPMLNLTKQSARRLGIDETIIDPLGRMGDNEFHEGLNKTCLERILRKVRLATPEDPTVQLDCEIEIDGHPRVCRFTCKTMWRTAEQPEYIGVIGRISDMHEKYIRAEQNKEAAISYALTASLTDRHENGEYAMSKVEATNLIQNLSLVFDTVRLVDSSINDQYLLNASGEFQKSDFKCFFVWNRNKRCEDCVSAKALSRRNKLTKFEFAGDEIYLVVAMYVEIEEKPYSLEMISKLTDETLLGGYGKCDLVESISSHNKKLYIDPVTGIYNRRYYEDQLKGLTNIEAAAMLDVDNFKLVNDTYGHQAGDVALRVITKAILSCIRSTDATVRYGGDEFVVVFRSIPKEIFATKLEMIREKVSLLAIDECPGFKFSVSIGGAYGPALMSVLLRRADILMYRAKERRNSVQAEQINID